MSRARTGQVKLADIARRVGVSTMTVSRVLRGEEHLVRPDTARRVRRAAAAMGRLPRGGAQPARPAAPMVVVCLPPLSGDAFRAALFDHAVRSIEQRRHAALVCTTPVALADALRQPGVAGGLLVAPPAAWLDAPGPAAPPVGRGGALVIVGADVEPAKRLVVGADVEEISRLACDHLLRLGHRSIAYLGGPAAESEPHWFEPRRRGLARALLDHGERHARIEHLPGDPPLIEAALQPFLRRLPELTGLLCDRDETAAAALAALSRMRLRAPEDLSVVGCYDAPFARTLRPGLTTIAVDSRAMAETAVNILLAASQSSEGSPPTRLPGQLIPRESSGPARG